MVFTEEQVRKIKINSLAEKHSCSHTYVTMILKGERNTITQKAKAILKDASQILAIIEK